MTLLRDTRRIYVNETEKKPNLYAVNVMTGIVGVLIVVWLLNQIGVFEVDNALMNASLAVCVIIAVSTRFFALKAEWLENPAVKYIIMSSALIVVLTATVLLNVHAVLAYVLPILLASQYRSRRVSKIALIGSCACCFIAPILAYFLKTFSLVFMTGYIENFCHVTIKTTDGNNLSALESIYQITLFWSLPQMLTLAAFGIILFSITDSGIAGVNDRMQLINLSDDLGRQQENMAVMQEKVLFSMSDIIESRDTETGGHVRRTSEIVGLLVCAMRDDLDSDVTEAFCASVIKCAPMHDLGKIAVPDTILRKPGRLTADEYETVKLHPVKSAEIIRRALTGIEDENLLTIAVNIAKYHHERFDGAGYPERLKGCEIPLEARLMAIADVYDALVSERCYKAPMPFDEAFETIEASMGKQFDPSLNKYFISCRREIEQFYKNAKQE